MINQATLFRYVKYCIPVYHKMKKMRKKSSKIHIVLVQNFYCNLPGRMRNLPQVRFYYQCVLVLLYPLLAFFPYGNFGNTIHIHIFTNKQKTKKYSYCYTDWACLCAYYVLRISILIAHAHAFMNVHFPIWFFNTHINVKLMVYVACENEQSA